MGIDFEDIFFLVVFYLWSHWWGGLNSFSVWCVIHHIGDNDNRLIDKSCWDFYVLDVIFQFFLSIINQWLVNFGQIFDLLSEVIIFIGFFKIVSSDIDDFVFFIFSKMVNNSLIQGVITKNNFISFSN